MLIALGGIAIGGLGYHLVELRRLRPARRREAIARQLAAAQAQHERHRIAAGPLFPRALAHLTRIVERAQAALRMIEASTWAHPADKDECIRAMLEVIRHCEELADAMRPPRRRGQQFWWL